MQTATHCLQFSLRFSLHLRVNVNFVLNPIRCVARGAGDEIAELPDVFLHVASGGVACEGKALGPPAKRGRQKTQSAEEKGAIPVGPSAFPLGGSLLHPQMYSGVFSTPKKIYQRRTLPVTMLFIGYSWRVR